MVLRPDRFQKPFGDQQARIVVQKPRDFGQIESEPILAQKRRGEEFREENFAAGGASKISLERLQTQLSALKIEILCDAWIGN